MIMMSLGEALVKRGLITREHLRLALERQVVFGGRIGTNIVELGILKEEDLSRFLSEHLKVPGVSATELTGVDEDTISSFTGKIAEKYKAVPFRKEKNRLHIAMMDPRNFQAMEDLRFLTGYDIIPYVASELRLLYALERFYGIKRDLRFISILDQQAGGGKGEQVKPSLDEGHLKKIKEEFASVKSREEIAGLMLAETKRVARRASLFLVKGQDVAGWISKDLEIRNFTAPSALPGIFNEVLMRKVYYRGPLLKTQGNTEFAEILGGYPPDCILSPVVIRDRIVCMLYADNGTRSVLDANITYANKIVGIASLAFEILVIRKKIMDL